MSDNSKEKDVKTEAQDDPNRGMTPPVTYTVEVDGKKKRVWTEEGKRLYAERRRERYRKDKDYRESVQDKSRQVYRDKVDMQPEELHKAIMDNVARIDEFGEVRDVYVGLANVGEEFCMTEPDMANMLNLNEQSFQRMVADGRFPRPVFSTRNFRTRTGVYRRSEALAMAPLYADHVKVSAHYYLKHRKTITAIRKAYLDDLNRTELGRWALKQHEEQQNQE